MNHTLAVELIHAWLEDDLLPEQTKAALSFLVKWADSVEELADSYIEHIDNGPLEAWVDAYENEDFDLDDQRLFDHEEMNYEVAHVLVGQEFVWPDGYMEFDAEEESLDGE